MSAWVVSKEHIDCLLAARLQSATHGNFYWYFGPEQNLTRNDLRHDNADEVGAMLWRENVISVQQRYPADSFDALPGPIGLTPGDVDAYRFPVWSAYTPTAVETLKAISCFEYQSCEHPGWEESSARGFCQALRHAPIAHLEGYEQAPWGFDSRTIAACKARPLTEVKAR